jgi:hypothetical protein
MHYDFIAIPDADVPQAVDPIFQHVVTTYASEASKTASVWRAVPDHLLDFQPHEKTNPIRTILVHQLLSERRFFAQFVGTEEPPVEELLPAGHKPTVSAYLDKYIGLTRRRLPQLAQGPPPGGWSPAPSSAGCCGSGFGCSGGGCCTPATTARRCRPGCAWPGNTPRRSTARPAT